MINEINDSIIKFKINYFIILSFILKSNMFTPSRTSKKVLIYIIKQCIIAKELKNISHRLEELSNLMEKEEPQQSDA